MIVEHLKHSLFFKLSMGILVIVGVMAIERTVFLLRAERTIGDVTHVTAHNSRCSSRYSRYDCTLYSALVRYVVDDVPYFLQLFAGEERDRNRPTTLARYQVGQQVSLIFDPRRPATAIRNTFSDLYAGPGSAFVMLMVFLAASFRQPQEGLRDEEFTTLDLNRPADPLSK
jgi:hypothetical protein